MSAQGSVEKNAVQNVAVHKGESLWHDSWKRLKRNPTAMFGLFIITVLALVAIFAPWLAPYDPMKIDLFNSVKGPSQSHWLGTDYYGRDILSRIIYGTRISMTVGFVVQAITSVIGVSLGAIAGYYGGVVDMLIMRLVDIIMAFPGLLFIIAVRVALGPGLMNVFIAMSIVGWTSRARLVRSQVLAARETEYVEAARALGVRTPVIIFKHVLPNCLAPVIVGVTMGIASAIMAEAGLSFLGLGVQEPIPSWGSIVNEGLNYLRTAPWYSLFPGAAIALLVLGFNLLGDGLRDALDPRMKD